MMMMMTTTIVISLTLQNHFQNLSCWLFGAFFKELYLCAYRVGRKKRGQFYDFWHV